MKIPAVHTAVNATNEIFTILTISCSSAPARDESGRYIPAITVTIIMLRVFPAERIVASIDDAAEYSS